MFYLAIQWILLLSQLMSICAQSSRETNTTPLIPTTDWETTMTEMLSKLEHVPADDKTSKSTMVEMASLFFPRWNEDIFRQLSDQAKSLVNTSLLEVYSASGFAKRFQEFAEFSSLSGRDLEFALRSLAVTSISLWQESAVKMLLFECENWYARLVDSVDNNQTFVLAVPLSYLHLSVLKERFIRSEGDSKEESQRDLIVWLATYWQFVYDGYVNWKEWRMSQLQIERWIQTTVIHDICHAILWDRLSQRHLVNLQIENCADPHGLDSHLSTILSHRSNQLEFEMMSIVSKVFVLHKLIPGYDNDAPYSGNYPNSLTLGPFVPLTYQIHRNRTIFNGTSSLRRTCLPSLSNDNLKGITNITVHRRDWVTGIEVQYENGIDKRQNRPVGTAESMSFDPHSSKCLASLKWTFSSAKSIVTSVTLTGRDGRSIGGSSGNKADLSHTAIFTTAPALYCINAMATCADSAAEFGDDPAVSGFQVYFGIPNATSVVPEPIAKGLLLTKGSPVFALVETEAVRKLTMKNSGFDVTSINRFRDVDGYSIPQSLLAETAAAATAPSYIVSTTPGMQGISVSPPENERQRKKIDNGQGDSSVDPATSDISPVIRENKPNVTPYTTEGQDSQNIKETPNGSANRGGALSKWNGLIRSRSSSSKHGVPGRFKYGNVWPLVQTTVAAADGSPSITGTAPAFTSSDAEVPSRNRSSSSAVGSPGEYGKDDSSSFDADMPNMNRTSSSNFGSLGEYRQGASASSDADVSNRNRTSSSGFGSPREFGKDASASSEADITSKNVSSSDFGPSGKHDKDALASSDADIPMKNRSSSSKFGNAGAHGKDVNENSQRGRYLEGRNRPVWKDAFGPNILDVLKPAPRKFFGFDGSENPNGTVIHDASDVTDRRFPTEVKLNLTEPLGTAARDGRLWAITDEDGNWIIVYPLHGQNTTGLLPLTFGSNIDQAIIEAYQTATASSAPKRVEQLKTKSVLENEQ